MLRAGKCPVRYTVTRTDAGAIVRVLAYEHAGHDTGAMTRHIAPWCREFIRMEFYERPGVGADELLKVVRKEALRLGVELGRKTEPSLSTAELEARWLVRGCEGQYRREYLITKKHIRDEICPYQRDKSELMTDEAASIAKRATVTHKDDTLVYRPGVEAPDGAEEDVRCTRGCAQSP